MAYDAGSFSWDTFLATPNAGPLFKIRISCVQDPGVTDASDRVFTLHNQPIHYYVNDVYDPASNMYCTAAGNDTNDGTTPATPKATTQAIIDTYDLEPGDVVYIDTGVYTLTANITVGAADAGDTSGMVRFVGSTHPSGTLIDRNSTSSSAYAWHLNGSGYVSIENMRVTKGYYGVYVSSASNCSISGCRVYGANPMGVYVSSSNYTNIRNSVIDTNSLYGVYLLSADYADITNNTICLNGTRQTM